MRSILGALLLAAATSAGAADLLGPADYLKILMESRLHYKLNSEPSKTPVAELNCPRRDETTRLKVDGDRKSLVTWAIKPEAKTLLEEGEKLYQSDDLAGAAEKYKAALAADPEAVSGYYFLGDTLLFGEKDAEGALAQYRKGMALDPTMPSGHFFSSTALVQLGRPDEAREEIIKALTYYPGYEAVWKMADKSYDRWNIKPIVRHKFEPPPGYLGAKSDKGIDIYGGANGQWLGYALCKAVWGNERQFKKQHGDGGWNMDEEYACVLNQLATQMNATKGQLGPLEQHLLDVGKAKLLEGYILFEIIGQHCPLALGTLSEEGIKQIDGYIRKFVIVAR